MLHNPTSTVKMGTRHRESDKKVLSIEINLVGVNFLERLEKKSLNLNGVKIYTSLADLQLADFKIPRIG